jgi:transposase
MGKTRNTYSDELKLKIVLESMQRDTTIEKIKQRFQISPSALHRWRTHFKSHAASVFSTLGKKDKNQNKATHSAEDLTKIIGDLTIENSILKKALEHLG